MMLSVRPFVCLYVYSSVYSDSLARSGSYQGCPVCFLPVKNYAASKFMVVVRAYVWTP